MLFHGGTSDKDGVCVTSGGRVMTACGFGQTLADAVKNAYAIAHDVEFEDKYFRKDIGKDLMDFCN
jgi:phosphoribosylamine---glycine ligase